MLTVHVLFSVILSWFVNISCVDKALINASAIEEPEVECNPDLIPIACLDQAVDVVCVRKHFTPDAWMAVQSVFKAKANFCVQLCSIC
jgi:hypothetical protein